MSDSGTTLCPDNGFIICQIAVSFIYQHMAILIHTHRGFKQMDTHN